jgi:hypothetical protein
MNAPIKMSILSQRAAKGDQVIKLGGKIRPGIKVLTNKAKENPKIVAIYEQGVARRMKFTEIEKQIKDATGMDNPMYPKNTPHFNVAASDFGMPEIASLIVEKYGEIREGDVKKQLYRFPVVFHSDDLNEIYPNEFKRYGGEPNYESHYGDDGKRYCRYLPEVTSQMLAEQKASRIKRPPRREKVIRGECEPNFCPEFLSGQCKFRGRLHFYIPGIPTTGLLAIETTSEYAAEAIYADLDRIYHAFGGIPRSNPNNPGAHIFFITKVQEQRTYFDEQGKKKMGLQWVPKLQADIDMGALLSNSMTPLLGATTAPVAWLAKPKGMSEAILLASPETNNVIEKISTTVGEEKTASIAATPDTTENKTEQVDPMDELEVLIDSLGVEDNVVAAYFDIKLGAGWEVSATKIIEGNILLRGLAKSGGDCPKMLIQITMKSTALKLEQKSYLKYLSKKHGKGFTGNEATLSEIINELDTLLPTGVEMAQSYIDAQLENLCPV